MKEEPSICDKKDIYSITLSKQQRVEKLLSGLGTDYTIVLLINLDTDNFEIILNQSSNNIAHQPKTIRYRDYLDNYANQYVVKESKEDMKYMLRTDHLLNHFQNHKDLYFRFASVPNSLGQTHFEAHAVRQYEKEGHFAVIGFRCVDGIVEKELAYQRELDKAYQLARKQLDVITASLPGGLKISYDDDRYTFKYVSKQYAAILGYTVPELLAASGGSIIGIAHPDDLERGIQEALSQYETSDSYAITYRMRCKDGSYKYIEDHGHKVITEDGRVEHWNLILDKDELVNKTIELETARRADEMKTAFLSRMSHDIRTPLNGILGLLEYALRHPDDIETIRNNRKKAYVASKHLLSLVNDVLELNKLDDRKITLLREPFDLLTLLQEVNTITEMRSSDYGITLHINSSCLAIKNRYLFGSPLHIKQILINIISNAIKYNHPSGSVWCQLKEKELPHDQVQFTFSVVDNGIGMSQDFLKKIFDPFAQEAPDSIRTHYTGTGLGMAIVKRLIDRMGGRIKIKSTVGTGTSVEIVLIFDKSDPIILPPPAKGTQTEDLQGVRALLVEDNELNMEIAKFILDDAHIEVVEAQNGKKAIEEFQNHEENYFDVILMDVMMPVMDGLTATKIIRKLPRKDAKTIPIFAMTANAFAEDAMQAREAGMNEHLSKPLDIKQLISKIAQYCKTETDKT